MMHTSSLFIMWVAFLPGSLEAWFLPKTISKHAFSPSPQKMGSRLSISTSATQQPHSLDVDENNNVRPRKLVIVGSGIGGLSSAFDARHMLHPKDEIMVVSARDTFQFTPSNPWVATRYRKPEDITLQIEPILTKHNIHFVHSEVTKLDPKRQELKLKDGKENLQYDFLIIATGPRLAFEDIPGTGPKGHAHSVCTTPHASEAAEAVDRLAADPGPVVIGAVQGASCFGPAYEFALLLNHELVKRGGKQLAEKCHTTFVTSEPYVGHLGLQGAGKSNEILERLLVRKKMDWITNCSVKKVTKDAVAVEYLEDTEGDGKLTKRTTKTLPSKFTMLIPAFKNMKVWTSVRDLTDAKSEMILTNKFQQSVTYPNIFGVGICAHLDTLEATPIPTGAPKTGYMIESMGTAAVKNIKGMIDFEKKQGQEEVVDQKDIVLHNVPLLNGLCITDFGTEGAIFLTLPQQPPRRTDITVDGKVATLAKIAFEKYFIHKIETGDTDPYYEKYMLHLVGVDRAIET